MSNKYLTIGVVLAIIIASCALFATLSGKSPKADGISTADITSTNYTQLSLSNGLFVNGGGILNTNGCISNNGVTTCTVRQALVSGTSTPCSIANPITTGTSTILSAYLNISTATSSAITWAIGTSTTSFATSTSLISPVVAANQQAQIGFVGTAGSQLIAGNFTNFGAGAGTAGSTGAFSNGIVLAGFCEETVQSVN